MTQIKFNTFGSTSAGGSFAPGDIMRCDEKLARHLVEDAKCAVYLNQNQAAQPVKEAEAEVEPVQNKRARRSNKD